MPPSRASNMSSYPNQGPSRRLGWPMKPNPGSARAATGAPVMRPILACLSAASAWTVASTMVTRAWNAGLVGASLPMICGPLLDRPPDIDEAVSLRVTSRPSPAFSPISHQKLALAHQTQWGLGPCFVQLTASLRAQGDLVQARRCAEEAYRVGQASGDVFVTATALQLLGEIAVDGGDYAEAESQLEKARRLHEELDSDVSH